MLQQGSGSGISGNFSRSENESIECLRGKDASGTKGGGVSGNAADDSEGQLDNNDSEERLLAFDNDDVEIEDDIAEIEPELEFDLCEPLC